MAKAQNAVMLALAVRAKEREKKAQKLAQLIKPPAGQLMRLNPRILK